MDIRGTWNLYRLMTRDENLNIIWKSVEEYLADPNIDDDFKKGVDGNQLVIDDEFINFLAKIPEGVSQEEIDEALASGELKLFSDNLMLVEKKGWKDDNGVLKFDTGAKGEVMGEPIDPWSPIKFTDDGLIELMVYRYKKAD
ncbi:MAG: hypothetical protein IKP47_00545 [Ruminococcus sp.]|nr:hypothetical protein [Ruminococcus sp.]